MYFSYCYKFIACCLVIYKITVIDYVSVHAWTYVIGRFRVHRTAPVHVFF